MDTVEAVFRHESAAVVAALMRRGARLDQAEDALQDAVAVATETWPRDGFPDRPGAWLLTAARRRLIDRIRREARRADKELLSALANPAEHADVGEDDRLRLIFTCCHGALSLEARVALTLRSTCGLTTAQIASVFVVPEATMAQRLVRAQRKIAVAKIPFEIPTGDELGPRLGAVLAVVYAVFTAGYNAAVQTDGDALGLCDEAIRLGRLLHLLMPREADVMGLVALMLLHHARRRARVSGNETVLFDEQDRSSWNAAQIAEGLTLIERATQTGPVGQYWLQAAITAEHMAPPTVAERNWDRISTLYERLVHHSGSSPVVRLNYAIAVSMADGPEAGLALLDPLCDRLDAYSAFHGARADCLARAGRRDEALAAYAAAIDTADSDMSRRSLRRAVEKLA